MRGWTLAILIGLIGAGIAAAEFNDEVVEGPVTGREEVVRWRRIVPYLDPETSLTVWQSTDTITSFTVTPEHHYWIDEDGVTHRWGNGVRHYELPRVMGEPQSDVLEIPWVGCVAITATFKTAPFDSDGDGWPDATSMSPESNEILRGDCMDPPPPPVFVTEPSVAGMMLAGVIGLTAFGRAREKSRGYR